MIQHMLTLFFPLDAFGTHAMLNTCLWAFLRPWASFRGIPRSPQGGPGTVEACSLWGLPGQGIFQVNTTHTRLLHWLRGPDVGYQLKQGHWASCGQCHTARELRRPPHHQSLTSNLYKSTVYQNDLSIPGWKKRSHLRVWWMSPVMCNRSRASLTAQVLGLLSKDCLRSCLRDAALSSGKWETQAGTIRPFLFHPRRCHCFH